LLACALPEHGGDIARVIVRTAAMSGVIRGHRHETSRLLHRARAVRRGVFTRRHQGCAQDRSDARAEASVNAQNIKIVTQDGVVTLRGPVASQEEKDRIGKAAEGLAGVVRVDNQLEVETK
jgi:hypothetical protein